VNCFAIIAVVRVASLAFLTATEQHDD